MGIVRRFDRLRGVARSLPAWEVAGITLLALAARLIRLDHPPFVDEMNHVLAARSLVADGTLDLPGGEPYTRAWVFTYLVAGLFRLFGESLVVARIPGVLAGSLLVAVLFVWVRAEAGRLAAWIAALLLCFYPGALFLSQLGRFYTIHALFYWVGALCIYRLASPGLSVARVWGLLGAAGLSLGLAYLLQTGPTGLGILCLAVWVAVTLAPRLSRWIAADRRRLIQVAGVVAVLIVLAVVGRVWYEAARMVSLFYYADLWAMGASTNWRFYHYVLLGQYSTVWHLFPILVVLAVLTRRRPSLFLAWLFFVPLVVHSLAAWKAERFVFYLMPAFFGIAGMAIADLLVWLRERLRAALGVRIHRPLVSWVVDAGLVVLVLFSWRLGWATNASFPVARGIVTQAAPSRPGSYPRSDWRGAASELREWLDTARVLVASESLKAWYYFGRADYDLSAEHLHGTTGRLPELTTYWKTGRPIISTAASLAKIMGCHPRGLVVIERVHWREHWAVPPETADYLLAHATPVPLSDRLDLLAFRWDDRTRSPSEDCSGVEVSPSVRAAPTP